VPASRLKLQVWSERQHVWRTAYCLVTVLHENLIMLKAFGFRVRVGGRYEPY
jgi:hypothetical protein